jgi:hypothetical protein
MSVAVTVVGVVVCAWFAWRANNTAQEALTQSQQATELATRPRVSLVVSPIDGSNTYCLASNQNGIFVLQYCITYRNAGNSTAIGLNSPAEVWLDGQPVGGMKQEEMVLAVLPGEELASTKLVCVGGMEPSKLNALVQSVNEGTRLLKMEFQLKYSPESDKSNRYRSRIRYEIGRHHMWYTHREYD